MKWFSKAAVGGLLWLTCAFAFADTIYFTGQPENVEQGGQFTAYLASNPSQTLLTYCVDDLNEIAITSPPSGYSVNIVDLAVSSQVTTDTRYGQTAAGSFSTNTVAVPNAIGTAQDRYAMAAWLITQYNFTSGVTMADDEIQNAIWTLLDATGATYTANGGIGTYITQAETWINGLSTSKLAAFESTVVIYSPTAVVGVADPARYNIGSQEMIGFVGTPEPATLAMLGAGLVMIGLFGKRIKAQSNRI
jgi:hypothetical protein